jgi:release factor glutamine methyltransferase
VTTISAWLKTAAAELTAAQTGAEQLDAELILGHVLGQNRAWIKAHGTDRLTAKQSTDASALITRRAAREPLVHLTGTREFYGLNFEITPDVLTPRVETEQMVDWAVKYAPQNSHLIDIGTGSGAIAIAIAKHRPDLSVIATDLSDQQLAVARRNAATHNTNVTFLASNLWSNLGGQTFDTVVTNLPYLPDNADLMPEVKREPTVALFGGPDGLGLYRRFLAGLPNHLAPGGYLFTESDPWQHEALIAEAARYGLTPVEQGYFIVGFKRRDR